MNVAHRNTDQEVILSIRSDLIFHFKTKFIWPKTGPREAISINWIKFFMTNFSCFVKYRRRNRTFENKNSQQICTIKLEEFTNYEDCFALPKLTYILRTTPLWKHQKCIDDMDNFIKCTLETLTNCQMDNHQWILSSLPIHCGGLGVRRVKDVYLPAFMSSVNLAALIVSQLLNMQELKIQKEFSRMECM